MANEPEVIRQQMEETRTALSEKLETLEQQMVQTVQGATTAVAETVENVKEAVQETVESVKGGVQQTVESVKNTFDLPLQVERHPWGMMAGAMAAGFLTGWLVERRSGAEGRLGSLSYPEPTTLASQTNGGLRGSRIHEQTSGPSWLSQISETFGSELGKVKGLAIGTLFGLLRDRLAEAVPEHYKDEMVNMVNRLTTKLGGEPIEGPVMDLFKQEDTPAQPRPEQARPMGGTIR